MFPPLYPLVKADLHWRTSRHDSARTRRETVSVRAQLALCCTVCSFLRESCMATIFCIGTSFGESI